MLEITVTAKNNEKGLKALKKFEKILRSRYVILCKLIIYSCRSRCEDICTCPCKTNRIENSNDALTNSNYTSQANESGEYTIKYTVTNESPNS